MPLLMIETNAEPSPGRAETLSEFSAATAEMLGKPESYVMVSFRYTPDMLFAGTDEAVAFVELKSLGLPEDKTGMFAARLCALCKSMLNVPPERVYIEFKNGQRHMWGWDSATF